MLVAVLTFCGLRIYISSPRLKRGHFNRTPGRRPTFAIIVSILVQYSDKFMHSIVKFLIVLLHSLLLCFLYSIVM